MSGFYLLSHHVLWLSQNLRQPLRQLVLLLWHWLYAYGLFWIAPKQFGYLISIQPYRILVYSDLKLCFSVFWTIHLIISQKQTYDLRIKTYDFWCKSGRVTRQNSAINSLEVNALNLLNKKPHTKTQSFNLKHKTTQMLTIFRNCFYDANVWTWKGERTGELTNINRAIGDKKWRSCQCYGRRGDYGSWYCNW